MAIALIFASLFVIPACFGWFWRAIGFAILYAAFVMTTINIIVLFTPLVAIASLLLREPFNPLEFIVWAARGGYLGAEARG